jgi:hypothetical protein
VFEHWTLLKQRVRRIEAEEKKFLTSVAGYVLHDHRTNEVTREERNMYNLNKLILDYRCKWIQRVFRIKRTGIPKLA